MHSAVGDRVIRAAADKVMWAVRYLSRATVCLHFPFGISLVTAPRPASRSTNYLNCHCVAPYYKYLIT